jgi:type I restriction enzyme S subunit
MKTRAEPRMMLMRTGVAQPALDLRAALDIEIPLPPLDVQAQIAAELDALERDAAKYEESAAAIERTQRAMLVEVEAAPKTRLGDVCAFKAGRSITKAQLREGPFPVVGGGVSPMGYHAEYNTEANVTIVSKDGAGAGFVSRYPTPIMLTGHGYAVLYDLRRVSAEYGFHVMKTRAEPRMMLMHTGVAQPALDLRAALDLEVPIPPMDVQLRIAAELDALEETKRGLHKAADLARRAMRSTLDARLGATLSATPSAAGAAAADSDWSDMDTASI